MLFVPGIAGLLDGDATDVDPCVGPGPNTIESRRGAQGIVWGLTHATLVVGFYGGSGVHNPFSAVLSANSDFSTIANFPYPLLGFAAPTRLVGDLDAIQVSGASGGSPMIERIKP